jgi:peroxiredoxin
MRANRFIGGVLILWSGCVVLLVAAAGAAGQDAKNGALDPSIKAIDDEYNQELLRLDRRRLERLAQLAASQKPAEAAVTYEHLFQLAVGGNLFREAEGAAKALLSAGSPSATATALAHMVQIIAEADRGAYDESIESLRRAVAAREEAAKNGGPAAELPTNEIVGICEAYYQRLIHAGQYATARKALAIIQAGAQRPAVKEFLADRLRRLETVGKPAPKITGTDVEGKPFDLAAAKGKVVLVVFWASWCLPHAAEIESLHHVYDTYRGRGLQIVGIDLDALSEGGQKTEAALANVRHFLLDYNVTWPTLINGQGEEDYAKAYGVTEIPANVLIGKDGTISHIDLVRLNLEPMIAKAVGE